MLLLLLLFLSPLIRSILFCNLYVYLFLILYFVVYFLSDSNPPGESDCAKFTFVQVFLKIPKFLNSRIHEDQVFFISSMKHSQICAHFHISRLLMQFDGSLFPNYLPIYEFT